MKLWVFETWVSYTKNYLMNVGWQFELRNAEHYNAWRVVHSSHFPLQLLCIFYIISLHQGASRCMKRYGYNVHRYLFHIHYIESDAKKPQTVYNEMPPTCSCAKLHSTPYHQQLLWSRGEHLSTTTPWPDRLEEQRAQKDASYLQRL